MLDALFTVTHGEFLALTGFAEPCFLVYGVPTPTVDKALTALQDVVARNAEEVKLITLKCSENSTRRVQLYNEAITNIVNIGLLSVPCAT